MVESIVAYGLFDFRVNKKMWTNILD